VPNALALFTFNMGASGKPNLTAKQLVLATIALFGVQIATAGVFALLLGPLIRLVYGAAFAGAVPLALALLPAQALNGFGQVIDGYLRGRGKVAPGIQARCVGAVVMLAVTMGLHQRLQEMAIPLAASIAQLCVAGMLGATLMFEAKEIVRQ
jgi:O-antigen/teichoic acid export membrane protein